MHPLLETLQSRFPQAVLAVHEDTERNELAVQVDAARLLDVAAFLHDDPVMAFDHITDIARPITRTTRSGSRSSTTFSRSRTVDGFE